MTTYNELKSLQTYLKSNVGCDVKIGKEEDVSQYPIIFLIPDENGLFTQPQQDRLNSFNFNIRIKLIDTDDRIIKSLQYMDRFITCINNFSGGKGHVLNEDFSTEYITNNYEVTFVYSMKIRLLNS